MALWLYFFDASRRNDLRHVSDCDTVNKFLISPCDSLTLSTIPTLSQSPDPHQASAHRRFNKKQSRAKHQVGTPLCPSIKTLKSLYSAWISTTMPLSARMCMRACVRRACGSCVCMHTCAYVHRRRRIYVFDRISIHPITTAGYVSTPKSRISIITHE